MIRFVSAGIYREATNSFLFFEEDFDDDVAKQIDTLLAGFVVLSEMRPHRTRKRDDDQQIRMQNDAQKIVAMLPPMWTETVVPEKLVEREPDWFVIGWSRQTISDAWTMAGGVLRHESYGRLKVVLATEALIQACESACPNCPEPYMPDYEEQLSKVSRLGIQLVVSGFGTDFICGLASESIQP